jgi:hypothetical protein
MVIRLDCSKSPWRPASEPPKNYVAFDSQRLVVVGKEDALPAAGFRQLTRQSVRKTMSDGHPEVRSL